MVGDKLGLKISGIVNSENISLKDLNGKVVAIDAYNMLYQFLSVIRQRDGTPLLDSKGKVTSHINGLFYRTANFMEFGIKPIFVFDGEPHSLKKDTVNMRIKKREEAKKDWEKALEVGDIEKARTKAQQSSKLTKEMVEESKRLLDHMGIPWVQAPSEGEAQAAYMVDKDVVYATVSQDFDSLLFGADILLRNMGITGKRKLPRRNRYVNIEPQIIHLNNMLKDLEISREQLVDMAILIGTDFNDGIHRVGEKTAYKLIKKHGNIENVFAEKGWKIDTYKEIREIFLSPKTTDKYELKWDVANLDKITKLLCEEHGFSRERIENALTKIEDFKKHISQKSLDKWF